MKSRIITDKDKTKIIFFSLLGMETWKIPPVSFLRQSHGALGGILKALQHLFCASCFLSHGWTGAKGRTYISKAQVRCCLSSTLLLVVCPVKVLARVTCRRTKQKEPSATTPHHRQRTKQTTRRWIFVFQHLILPQWPLQCQQGPWSHTMRANGSSSLHSHTSCISLPSLH